jgi:hypothetical protein
MGCFRAIPTAALVLLLGMPAVMGQELLPRRDVSISIGKLGSMVIPRLEESANLLVGGAVRFRNPTSSRTSYSASMCIVLSRRCPRPPPE